jgi:hypothetical protein
MFQRIAADLTSDDDVVRAADDALTELRWNDPAAFSAWSLRARRAMAARDITATMVLDLADDPSRPGRPSPVL